MGSKSGGGLASAVNTNARAAIHENLILIGPIPLPPVNLDVDETVPEIQYLECITGYHSDLGRGDELVAGDIVHHGHGHIRIETHRMKFKLDTGCQ